MLLGERFGINYRKGNKYSTIRGVSLHCLASLKSNVHAAPCKALISPSLSTIESNATSRINIWRKDLRSAQ